ncbi:hypothetical protein NMY22_g17055 [Coprinellus aureogranulatus]|nr:hypothetical protein NMY22_g17055 [Coprinellus aureogranulatus]
MKFSATILISIAISPLLANALWCDCIYRRGDPFNGSDRTYTVCTYVPGAVYTGSTWGGLRGPHCDVGSNGAAAFTQRCNAYGSDTTAWCN